MEARIVRLLQWMTANAGVIRDTLLEMWKIGSEAATAQGAVVYLLEVMCVEYIDVYEGFGARNEMRLIGGKLSASMSSVSRNKGFHLAGESKWMTTILTEQVELFLSFLSIVDRNSGFLNRSRLDVVSMAAS